MISIPEHLQPAVDKLLTGKATLEELRQVRDWFYSLPNDAIVEAVDDDLRTILQERIRERIHQSIFRSQASKVIAFSERRNTKKIYWKVAAAVLLLLAGTGTWYWFAQPAQKAFVATPTNSYPVQNDIAPGQNKAVLQLASGEKFVLDSSLATTTLSSTGIKLTKVDNGTLEYSATERNGAPPVPGTNTITVPRGGQYGLVLADGSKVWLNAESVLRFPTTFAGNTRNVELEGEAYFEVAKDAKRPFHVSVHNMDVEVLGTHFNIRSYPDDIKSATTLLEGKVKVNSKSGNALLIPGQQAQLDINGNLKVIKDVNVAEAVAWKDGYFQWDKLPLKQVMQQLSRWYDVEVRYEGDVKDEAIVGKYSRQANLSQTLQFLRLIDIHFRIEKKTIILLP